MDTALILFDDVCVLCNKFAQWIIAKDKSCYFRFAPLQSETGKMVLQNIGFDSTYRSSIILIDQGEVSTESDAFMCVLRHLKGYKTAYKIIGFLPKFLRNFVYRLIATNRYRLFGKTTSCLVSKDRILKIEDIPIFFSFKDGRDGKL